MILPFPLMMVGRGGASAAAYSGFGYRDTRRVVSNSDIDNLGIGPDVAGRHVILAIATFSVTNPALDSVEADNFNFTRVIDGTNGDFGSSIWIASPDDVVGIGTSIDLIVNGVSATQNQIAISAWSVVMSSVDSSDILHSSTGSGSSHTILSHNIPPNGFSIAVLSGFFDITSATINQSYVERYDNLTGSQFAYMADVESSAGMVNGTVTITSTGAGPSSQCVASWSGNGT